MFTGAQGSKIFKNVLDAELSSPERCKELFEECAPVFNSFEMA